MPNYIRENYSADLDFGTGEWSASAWVNTSIAAGETMNLIRHSEDFSNALWVPVVGGITKTTNSISFAAGSANRLVQDFNATTGTITVSVKFSAADVGKFIRLTMWASGFDGLNNVGSDLVIPADGVVSRTFTNLTGAFIVGIVNSSAGAAQTVTLETGYGVMVQRSATATAYRKTVASYEVQSVASRAHSSGASIQLGMEVSGKLQATTFDGTTTRTVTTTAAYNTATWIKPEAVYTTDGTLAIRVNGVEVAATRGTPLLPLYGRKNLFNYSHTFSNSVWATGNGAVKVSTSITDPDGGSNAVEVLLSQQYASLEYALPSVLMNGQQYTLSFWARRASGSNTLNVFTDSGQPISTYAPTTVWIRYSFTFVWGYGSSKIYVTQDRNGSGWTNVQLYGMQLELGASATAYVSTGVTPSDGHPLTIGNSFAADAPFPGSISLLKLSATVPTAEQSQWMYEQEKQMFRDGAQVTLPDAGSIVDLTYDDATDKWIAVSATNESKWSGLVRTSVTASPAGSYTKVSAASGVQLQARSTINPGVDITIPSYGLREELVRRAESAARLARNMVAFDYVGGFTANTTTGATSITSVASLTYPVSYVGARISGAGIPANTTVVGVSGTTIYISAAATATASAVQISFVDFTLPVGYEAREVLTAGLAKIEGATKDFTRLFDGFKETIRFGTAPGFNVPVQIQATRSVQ